MLSLRVHRSLEMLDPYLELVRPLEFITSLGPYMEFVLSFRVHRSSEMLGHYIELIRPLEFIGR